MQYRQLINADLKVSELGLGCASFWGKKSFSEQQAFAVFSTALDRGVNFFDTGYSYSGGYAEQRLGQALSRFSSDQDLVISSKAGTRLNRWGRPFNDFSPAWIRQSCEESLRRLNLDRLPLFFLHGPNLEDFTDELWSELAMLQQTGKIGLLGINAFADHILEHCLELPMIQCVMLDFNIYQPDRVKLIKKIKAAGKDVFIAGALAGAIYDQRLWRFRGRKSLWYWLRAWKNNPRLSKLKKQMQFMNEQPHLTATQVALAYVLRNQDLCSALVGSTQRSHLNELLDVIGEELTVDLVHQIESQASL